MNIPVSIRVVKGFYVDPRTKAISVNKIVKAWYICSGAYTLTNVNGSIATYQHDYFQEKTFTITVEALSRLFLGGNVT